MSSSPFRQRFPRTGSPPDERRSRRGSPETTFQRGPVSNRPMNRTPESDLADRIAGLSPAKRELFERKLRAREADATRSTSIPRRTERATAPLSFAQQRLYFLDRLDPDSAAYNVPRAIAIRGALDVAALERVFQELLRRHEVLRSRFVEREGSVVAEIGPAGDFRLEPEDVPGSTASEREREAMRIAQLEAKRPFDLATGPILRVRLLRLGPERHMLLFTNHHIVSDAWSAGVLFGELTDLYAAFSSGRPSPLPELLIQYGDFAAWQRDWLRGEVLEGQLDYWRRQLEGAPAVLELPTDSPRPVLQSFEGELESVRFSPELSAALRELSRRSGVTLFMTLLAAYQTLLFRYTRQSDILVGTPIANRNSPDIENLLGFFVNTLVLRTDLSGNPTFRELLGRVRDVAVGAYAHQDLPFEKLVEELHPGRDLGRNALFQTMLALKNTPVREIRWPGLELEHLDIGHTTSKFDVSVHFEDAPDGLTCLVEYATDLFERDTIRRMTGHLRVLLESVVADPDRRIESLPMMSEAERRQVVVGWNETAADYPDGLCLHELFEAQVEQTPRAVAIRDGSRKLRYEELNREANRLARYLRASGVERGSIVGICLERSARTVTALLAVLKAGAAYVPLDPSYPEGRITFMIRDSGTRVVLTEARSASLPADDSLREIRLDDIAAELASEEDGNLASGVRSDDLAYIIYTSGSTGTPKGVEAIHRASVNRFAWMWRAYPFAEGEVCCQKTTLSFVDSIWETFGPLLQGVPSVVLSPDEARDPRALVDRLSAQGVSRIVLVPSLLRALLDSGIALADRLARLKWWVTSGETLPLELQRRFRAAMPEAVLINLYGSSEVSADVTCWDSRQGNPRHSVPIGRPIANTQIYVLDETRQPVPIGIPGELYVGGDGLARGYRNRPELTAERFVPDPFSGLPGARLFKTGDRARFLADGQLEYLGRNDDQVKIRGYRIELGEIEAALAAHPSIDRAVTAVRGLASGEPRLVAYVVRREEGEVNTTALRVFLETRLPAFMIPAAFVFLGALPLTPSGKIDRKSLPAPEAVRPELERPFVAPSSDTELALAEIWKEVLGLDRVGVHDDFFALGGHSLLLIQVSSRLRKALRVELPLRTFFELPTIAGLARAVEVERADRAPREAGPAIIPAPAGAPLPLSFAQQRLWLIEQLDPGNTGYLIRRAYRLTGPLRADFLRQAVQGVAARHASLRTRFLPSDGGALQEILPPERVTVPFEQLDLTSLPPEQREAEASRLAATEAQRPFDLSRAPLLRVALLRLGPEEHLLLVTVHHIVSDAWSIGVLFHEIAELYTAQVEGRAARLPALPIQYGDYAVWQRTWLQGEALERQLSHWRSELAGAPEVLDLATDRPRPARRTSSGGRRPLFFPRDLSEKVKEMGRRHDATLYMTLLAVYAALLSQYTSQRDIVIGSPIAGRNRIETEPLIGLFLNTLVVRARLSGDPTFSELLGRIRGAALGAYAHQDLPFEKLVEELRPSRNLAHNPIFQVWFVLQNAPIAGWELPGIRATGVDSGAVTVRHDLQLTMWESEDGLCGSLDFSADLFDASTMDRISEELGVVLRAVASDATIRVSGIQNILKNAESRRTASEQERIDQAQSGSLKSTRRKAIHG